MLSFPEAFRRRGCARVHKKKNDEAGDRKEEQRNTEHAGTASLEELSDDPRHYHAAGVRADEE